MHVGTKNNANQRAAGTAAGIGDNLTCPLIVQQSRAARHQTRCPIAAAETAQHPALVRRGVHLFETCQLPKDSPFEL